MPERARDLLYRGSVKDVYGREGVDPYVFIFSDRYSIFDWGEMPDSLMAKGESLAVMGDLFFRFLKDPATWINWDAGDFKKSALLERLKKNGIIHHSLGLVDDAGKSLKLGERSRCMAVKALPRIAPVLEPGNTLHWNYSAYKTRPAPMLVPLEVVFRFGAPSGSSFLKRAEENPDYVKDLGFAKTPKADEWFSHPIVEFFTKLEPTDRFLTRSEAAALAALSAEEFQELEILTLLIASRLKDLFASIGLELWDGKFEFAFFPSLEKNGSRQFMLVDSIGPDELRLVRDNIHVSKEILRRHYRSSLWYRAVEKAKQLAEARGALDWKKICIEELGAKPDKLPSAILDSVANLYPALAEAISKKCFQKSVYPDYPPLDQVISSLGEIR